MAIVARRALGSDAALVALIGRLTFRETFGNLFEGHEADLAAYLDHTFSVAKIAASMAKPQNRYWLLEIDALPIGYAKLKKPSPNDLIADATTAQLQKIYVLAGFHGSGTGQALMAAVHAEATALGAASMWLTVLATNDRAIRFYHRNGWQNAGTATFAIGAQDFAFEVLKVTVAHGDA